MTHTLIIKIKINISNNANYIIRNSEVLSINNKLLELI